MNRPGGLYVVTGRVTFSAAGNLVTDLDAMTAAVIVGEPMGGAPNQYGDSMPVPLEHSGLVLRVAPDYIQRSDPGDPRLTIDPELPAPLTSVDYFADRDPALEAVLALG